ELDDTAGVIARRVARQDMVVCAAPSYLEIHGEPRRIEDLAGHQAIVYRRLGMIAQPWLFPREGQAALELMPNGRLRLDDLDAIADAAVGGMGLAWLPHWLVRERIQAGALVALLPDQPRYPY
ncbi:LysR substrate-binding domain-containing protein, partial [Mesorhizobium sp. M4B.F.Ca.ET.143.01.1.1]